MTKTNLSVYHFNDSFFYRSRGDDLTKDSGRCLLDNNLDFLQGELEKFTKEGYDKVIIADTGYLSIDLDDVERRVHSVVERRTKMPSEEEVARSKFLPMIQGYFSRHQPATLETVIDPFLMSDLYTRDEAIDVSTGQTISKPMTSGDSLLANLKPAAAIGKNIVSLSEDTYITTLYALIHRTALLNKDSDIVIDFYYSEKNMEKAFSFFSANPDMLPKNCVLRMRKYEGFYPLPETSFLQEIQGTGSLDMIYPWTVRLMAFFYIDRRGRDYDRLFEKYGKNIFDQGLEGRIVEIHQNSDYTGPCEIVIEPKETRDRGAFATERFRRFRDNKSTELPIEESLQGGGLLISPTISLIHACFCTGVGAFFRS